MTVKFQVRHYVAIASVLDKWLESVPDDDAIVFMLADMFGADNPQFDKARFLKACKL